MGVHAAPPADVPPIDVARAELLLVRLPLLGHVRADVADASHRFWPVRNFLIIYHPETSPLEIVRILRGSRDIPSLI